jgi:transcriptional regulator
MSAKQIAKNVKCLFAFRQESMSSSIGFDGAENTGGSGPLHGYGIARIEQISEDLLSVNQGTLYPLLLSLEQEGAIESDWDTSENNRRARCYRLTRDGRRQLQAEVQDWRQTTEIIARFLAASFKELS